MFRGISMSAAEICVGTVDGRYRFGLVQPNGAGWIAADTAGRSLGQYATRIAALEALAASAPDVSTVRQQVVRPAGRHRRTRTDGIGQLAEVASE
jgi:hypothetical protein